MRRFNGYAIVIGILLSIAAAPAAIGQDSPNRKEIKRTDLSGAPGMEVITSFWEYKPGETIPRHSHHGVETTYVIQGATLQQPGQEPRQIPAGAVIMNLRDVVHGGATVKGDTSFKLYSVQNGYRIAKETA